MADHVGHKECLMFAREVSSSLKCSTVINISGTISPQGIKTHRQARAMGAFPRFHSTLTKSLKGSSRKILLPTPTYVQEPDDNKEDNQSKGNPRIPEAMFELDTIER